MMPHRLRLDPLWGVVLLAVAMRIGVMSLTSGGFDDPDNYVPLARSVAEGNGFVLRGRPTAYRPPLYPLLLAGLVSKTGEMSYPAIALLHVVLGAGTVWLTAKAARGFGLSNRRANLAAFIVACDPVLVWQCRSVMTETPTAFLLALGFAGLCRPAWQGPLLGGLAFGLAALCRPSVVPGILLAIAVVLSPGPAPRRRALREPRSSRFRHCSCFLHGWSATSCNWASRSGQRLTEATPWRWPITPCITVMS